jgi:iron complex outermembrane receptor protein
MSISYNETGIDVEVSGFFHAIGNYIMAVPDAANPTVTVRGTFPTFRFTQMNAQLAGGDINATIALGRQISVYGSTALVRGINVDRDEPLLFVPSDRARIGLHLHAEDVWELHDAYVDLSLSGVRRQDRVVSGRDYAEPPAGYFRTDLSIGGILTFSDNVLGRLTLTCNNLFNVAYRDYLSQYRYFTDDPGRNIILRFTTSF